MSIKAISISSALLCLAAFGLAACGLAGCGGPKFDYAEVDGKVTLNGQALAGALVRFYPMSEGPRQLPYALGMTDADGVYLLTHHDAQPGAIVGKSRAVVSWPSRDMQSAATAGGPAGPLGPPIPLPYTTAAETPLIVEVKPGPRQTINLRLEE